MGAGFAGLTLARALRRVTVDVTLLDRNNYHLFTPLLYQVGSALLDPGEIAQPVRRLVRPVRNCEFRMACVTAFDLDRLVVHTDRGEVPYDYLVVAAGSVNNYFGNRSVEERSLGLKELPEALALRNHVLQAGERAAWAASEQERARLLTFAVVGGGPTGVEYAGALSELVRSSLRKDYRPPLNVTCKVLLLEGSDRLLATFDPRLSEAALRSLQSKGVEVRLHARVEEVRPGEISLSDGTTLSVGTVIWTAGVRGSDVGALLGVQRDRQGRVPVTETLQLEGRPHVFVIGDLAHRGDLPMLIPVAMQEAKHVARGIDDLVRGRAPQPFTYHDPGIMATIGRNSAVAQLHGLRFSGFIGWLMWLGFHFLQIVTLRARLVTLVNWAFEYFFYDRPVQISVRAEPPPEGAR